MLSINNLRPKRNVQVFVTREDFSKTIPDKGIVFGPFLMVQTIPRRKEYHRAITLLFF